MSATCDAALAALLPPGVTRTLYLCDDGADPAKRAWLEEHCPGSVYVAGRERAKGEVFARRRRRRVFLFGPGWRYSPAGSCVRSVRRACLSLAACARAGRLPP